MRIISDVRAVSTFILIILILCSAVLGALISYMLVISNYYNMPENTTLLIVENVAFPILDFTYFNVTILNPSNSASDVNITAIRLSAEGIDEIHDVTKTEPEPLPFLITIGTRLTFKCKENWSNFAGETVRIEPVTENASIRSCLYTTPKVKLVLTPNFDVSQSVEYFNLIVQNPADSITNLTLSEVMLFGMSIKENVTPSLSPPLVLSPSQAQTFRCNWNWESYMTQKVNITVKTTEGYKTTYTTDELPAAVLYIDDIKFDYAYTTYFNLIIKSFEESTAEATITAINLTLEDGVSFPINTTVPLLGTSSSSIPANQSLPITCFWNWTYYRDKNVTINAHTKRGFSIPNKITRTPPDIVMNITDTKFDLDHTNYFLINVTNMPCSLRNITIAKIKLNENETIFETQTVPPGGEVMFNCNFDWKDLIGKNATITVLTEDGLNVSRVVKISSVGLKLLGKNFVFGDLYDQYADVTVPYGNITVSNSINSLENVTVTKIIFETGNKTYEIDDSLTYPKLAPNGYYLRIGENITIVCIWDYTQLGLSTKVTVCTAEGFQVSRTWYIPTP